MAKMKNQGEQKASLPAQESDTHKKGGESGKFLGPTKGNADRAIDLTAASTGGKGESHSGAPKSPFLGDTKGNKDRPIDISRGTGGGEGGKYIAGRGNKVFNGNKGGFPK